MRVAQIVLPSASPFERRNQRADAEGLRGKHEIVPLAEAEVAHVYASEELSPRDFLGFPVPYLAGAPMKSARWSLPWQRKPRMPSAVLDPLATPEAVEERYWNAPRAARTTKTVGSFDRPAARNLVEQTVARIERFRDDVRWRVFADPPSPEDLAGVDAWADPADSDSDLDGFVAEALVVGLPVVAVRTAMNAIRLERGRTGWLVPPRDPNEMTHAILAALFKSELAENKLAAARQTISKFRARHRTRVLGQAYETLLR